MRHINRGAIPCPLVQITDKELLIGTCSIANAFYCNLFLKYNNATCSLAIRNIVTEKMLLTSVLMHEAHKKTKIRSKIKWAMVSNDLFQQESFRGFIPVQADSLSRKFKRLRKEFEDKFENGNPNADYDRMTEVEEILYSIRKEEIAGKLFSDIQSYHFALHVSSFQFIVRIGRRTYLGAKGKEAKIKPKSYSRIIINESFE
jgi:hypothetical protein